MMIIMFMQQPVHRMRPCKDRRQQNVKESRGKAVIGHESCPRVCHSCPSHIHPQRTVLSR